MADLDRSTANLVPLGGGTPTATPDGDPAGSCDFDSPGITAAGSVVLRGREGEDLGGWALGYIQLKFINTDYARYRGPRVVDGSVLITRSNLILCRDTDEDDPELWYDPIAGGIVGGRGTLELAAGTLMPAAGTFTLNANFGDGPGRSFDNVAANTATRVDNFLYHADIGLQFCTMLTVRDPAGHFTVLKHFYWNIRWECHYQRDGAGVPRVRIPADHFQLNIQRKVHSGVPDDPRFKGRELDNALPISNDVSRRPKRISSVRDWALG